MIPRGCLSGNAFIRNAANGFLLVFVAGIDHDSHPFWRRGAAIHWLRLNKETRMKLFACVLVVACVLQAERAAADRLGLPTNAHEIAQAPAQQPALEFEGRASHLNRFLVLTCGAIAVLALLALLASCGRGTRSSAEAQTGRRAPPAPEPPPRQTPPAPARAKGAGPRPSPPLLQPATVQTQAENALPCPECGALVDCPASIREAEVICASCRKTFRVH
jgi:hypothetical protein